MRIAFSSIAVGKGVDSTIVDFWQGHVIGEMKRVYQTAKREDLRQMYRELEPHLSITSPDGESLESLRKEMEARKHACMHEFPLHRAFLHDLARESQNILC